MKVDVKDLDADFYCFSGHKIYGPTGIGVLYCKSKFLEKMKPYQGGGEMISSVSFNKTTYQESPYKFEAGTPNIVGAIGLGSAIDYISKIKLENISFKYDASDFLFKNMNLTINFGEKIGILGKGKCFVFIKRASSSNL